MRHSKEQNSTFGPQDIKIVSKESLFSGFLKMVKCRFQHKLFQGGWSGIIERELVERGHAVALLPYDPKTDQVVIVEQIRVGALEDGTPWQFEIVAGVIDTEETSEQVAIREAKEEAGIDIGQLKKITAFYPSSGGCSEKIDVYIGETDATTAHGVHGLDYEGEDIKVHVMSRAEAYKTVESGIIENGASIIALQWLQMNYESIQKQWQTQQ
ncbi:ADP-ribose diphosphatase [Vibrio marisflavi]|uniref:ADP-ribose pyrophosphatase n=1 Tax=Vibrio marisflavi CECT 7928 TaxID=634439 RepID=A0ABM9A7I2_9VIBR|nr:ADP-ribose diphosphatase [Vibrio marisflavi]CAH0541350.1 ADP-ribose pyrophosphatase [Vibrio marisflavi CECT 7928]